ncbi:transport and golgi organization 1 [Calliopsis andreniformis]|uniref:transport and golgi organization 1 n=1 Tax=Calliopsis andreniformis TaxID=337506 RepID=UPI003FCE5DE8
MTKGNLFINVVFLLIAISFSAISLCSSALSNKQLCYDPKCSEPVSLAKTLINYNPNEPGLLGFDVNVDVTVYSKGAGNRTDIWGVKINGKRGYVPKSFLKEVKIFHKNLRHEVPINQLFSDNNVSNEKQKPKKDKDEPKVVTQDVGTSSDEPDTEKLSHNGSEVTPTYETIDGTTFQLDRSEPMTRTNFVNEVIQATAVVPNEQRTVDNVTASSNSEKVESNIFATNDNLLKETEENKVTNKKESFPEKVDIKDFVTSSEEILDVPKLAGIPVPLLNINTKLKDDASKKEKETSQNTDHGASIDVKDTQPKEELGNISVSELSNDATKALNETVQNANTNNDTTINLGKKKDNDSVVAGATDNKVDSETVQEVTNDKLSKGTESNKKESSSEKNGLKDFVVSSEEILDAPKIAGISVPQLNINAKLKGDASKEEKETTQNTEHGASTDVKDTQPREELGNISVSEISNDTTKALNETVQNANTNNDTTINLGKKEDNDSVVAGATDNKVNSETVQEVTNDKLSKGTESNKKESSSEKGGLKDFVANSEEMLDAPRIAGIPVSLLNINAKLKGDASKGKEETSQKTGHDTVTKDAQPGENFNNISVLETSTDTDNVTASTEAVQYIINTAGNSDTPLKAEETKSENTGNLVLLSLEESNVNNLAEDALSSSTSEGNINEQIAVNLENTSAEQNLTSVVSSTSQDTSENLEENNTIVTNNSNEELQKNIVQDVQHENEPEKPDISSSELLYSTEKNTVSPSIVSINEFRNRNLLNADIGEQIETENVINDETDSPTILTQYKDVDNKVPHEDLNTEDNMSIKEETSENTLQEVQVSPPEMCSADNVECSIGDSTQNYFTTQEGSSETNEYPIMEGLKLETGYWITLMYLSVTAIATLIFSLGYYYIENLRRDRQLIARINKLEKDLLVSTKECGILSENLKLTKDKLTSIEDESFGSNEMVLSLKADLEASQNAKAELEDQVAMLERDLEGATEAGLELERMLREVLSSDNEVNPLAQSVEDLQKRLNAQQAANESLTNALNLKTQENESLTAELASLKQKYEELEIELTQVMENLKAEVSSKKSMEQMLTDKVQQLEMQIKEISTEKIALQKELKGKKVEMKDLMDVISRLNSNNVDFDKLYDVSRIKAEAVVLREERDELKERLTEVEGAHSLLEEHMKVIKEEVTTLSEQCKTAEKEKKDAETRLEVLSNFFQEKEAQRQKEEAIWLQQQGEVLSTVERIQTMQNEIQNYKQQIEMLKREILDQEREYKHQISVLETKAHEQWVVARQVERRLEESKVEAGQLRNRLTLIEKNMNDVDSEVKLHRLEANGETTTSPPLFLGAESSNSPIMFSGSTNVPPPPPPSYLHSLFPPYLPPPLPNASGVPPYEVSQRPPPLGGRLSSPPPMPLHPPSSRYDHAGSPPPPMSPHLLPPFDHRSPPLPFGSDHIHPPPPPPGSILPPPLGTTHTWGEESLPPPRNSGFHPPQRERVRNHKGSLHSSGESLDKTHHHSKV